MEYFPSIKPVQNVVPQPSMRKTVDPQAVNKEFMSIFFSQLLKQFLKEQKASSIYPQGVYENPIYNDLFIEQISKELVESGTFEFKDYFPPKADQP